MTLSVFSPSRARAVRSRRPLSSSEWSRLATMGGAVIALHVIGWVSLAALVAPHHAGPGGATLGVGVGLTAYTLGMRHAFDADHIAAIDNTTRKLMNTGDRPLSVGFWFSLGHSSIVFGLALLLSAGVRSLVGPVSAQSSSLHHYTGLIGTSVSGGFLYLIAAVNVVILLGIAKVFRQMRDGALDEEQLEDALRNRGLLNRWFGRATRAVSKPWHMYPVGALFGLGFDTASEVALLVLAGTSTAVGLPWYAVLCLPVLFAAGMTLLDTLDGTFMNFAYGWALSKPVRKVYYNLTITGLSVAVAFVIGTVELLTVLSGQLGWSGGFWHWIGSINLNVLGFGIVGLFAATWVAAMLVWRFGRIEQKWSAGLAAADDGPV